MLNILSKKKNYYGGSKLIRENCKPHKNNTSHNKY